ncbi:SGS domain protein [Ancylostoma duodenale]|uniref:SGS domain protein n=1 Tax=Ancylostoma duodenale TaxID=51022 RepID=A0A0C2CQI7_9BILA|nr:SGS domain protein [Ancylostoma duodenale]
MDAKELTLDVDELRLLLTSSKRPAVQEWIKSKIEEIERRIASQKEKQPAAVSHSIDSSPATDANKSATPSSLPTVKVTNYGWDESDKFVKVYITLQGVHNANPSTIQHSFSNLLVTFYLYLNYVLDNTFFTETRYASCNDEEEDRREEVGTAYQTGIRRETEESCFRKPKFDDKAMGDDPQASLMTMMKQMYEEGDDELKRTIRKAWHEGQNKRNTAEMPSLDDL